MEVDSQGDEAYHLANAVPFDPGFELRGQFGVGQPLRMTHVRKQEGREVGEGASHNEEVK